MDREKTSDVQLLRSIAAGDKNAFAEFYDRYAARAFGFLLQRLGRLEDAEDVLQEIFWQVWSRAHSYDAGRATPAVWLFLLVRSRALDHLRCQRQPVESPGASEKTAADPGSVLEVKETAQQVRQALTQLSQEQRSAIHLAFYEGLTSKEIAQCQVIPLGTAKTRIRSGMKRLRDLLSEQP
jgi:RNA polymerase sigma-70 factor (ECF subfamily)